MQRHTTTLARFERHLADERESPAPLRTHAALLNQAVRDRHLRFDPLRQLGWTLREHQARDVLAELLDPAATHGLKAGALLLLLKVALRKPFLPPELRLRLTRIQDLARRATYQVETEYPVANGRIDLAVLSPQFFLFIELKRSNGAETWAHGRAQLRRHLDALRARARDLNIEAWSAVLIAPEGILPSTADCVVISPKAVASAFTRLRSHELDSGALAAFLGAYSRC